MSNQAYIDIPLPLQAWVRAAWIVNQAPGHTGPRNLSFYADGSPGLLFYGAPKGLSVGASNALASFLVYGQTVKPVTITAVDNSPVICISFHPHVLASLFEIDAFEITDKCLELQLLPAIPRISLSRLWAEGNTVQQQADIIFTYLRLLIARKNASQDHGLAYATATLLKAKGNVPLKKLQTELNCTERTLERRFKQFVGVTPTLFSGVSRFNASLHQLMSQGFNQLSDIAYDNGYADQSHFNRQFKSFTGSTPLAFYRKAFAIA